MRFLQRTIGCLGVLTSPQTIGLEAVGMSACCGGLDEGMAPFDFRK
jgi:hypothetical protein